eukprot:TRINITY_DN5998_c0_g1_i2.p1 TRINITY_DN5998_c0_g1~~TRINITY_DN5998_c0_g1_i2.p1  ORF type:complete len:509 (+),score=165.65 TRINITY_DN5998_c0_g1_i2:61-1587(+)
MRPAAAPPPRGDAGEGELALRRQLDLARELFRRIGEQEERLEGALAAQRSPPCGRAWAESDSALQRLAAEEGWRLSGLPQRAASADRARSPQLRAAAAAVWAAAGSTPSPPAGSGASPPPPGSPEWGGGEAPSSILAAGGDEEGAGSAAGSEASDQGFAQLLNLDGPRPAPPPVPACSPAPAGGSAGAASPPGRAVLLLSVDLGGGARDVLRLQQGESPAQAAAGFVARHGLPDALCDPLARHCAASLAAAAAASPPQPRPELPRRSPPPPPALTPPAEPPPQRPSPAAAPLQQQGQRRPPRAAPPRPRSASPPPLSPPLREPQRPRSGSAGGGAAGGAPAAAAAEPAGWRLYEQGLLRKRLQAEEAARELQQRADSERRAAPFAPRISAGARRLAARRSRPGYQHPGGRRGAVPRPARSEEREMELCTFRPQLSQRSQRIVTRKREQQLHAQLLRAAPDPPKPQPPLPQPQSPSHSAGSSGAPPRGAPFLLRSAGTTRYGVQGVEEP